MARLLVVASLVGGLGILSSAVERDTTGTAPETIPAAPRAPAGLEPGSLITRAGFGGALGRLRAARLGRIYTLRVAANRVDARLLTSRGRIRDVRIGSGGTLRRRGTSPSGFGFVDAIPFGRVDPAAPARLTRAAARRLGLPSRRVDFLSLTRAGWTVVFDDGRQRTGDLAGRIR